MTPNNPTDSPAPNSYVPTARPVALDELPPAPEPHPMLLSGHPRRAAGWDVAIFIAMGVVVHGVMTQIVNRFVDASGGADTRPATLVLTLIRGVVLVGAVTLVLRARRQPSASIGLCSDRWWVTGLFGIVAAVGAYAALIASLGVIALVYPSGFAAMQRNPERIIEQLPRMHPILLGGVGLFVGLYEEIIFRGFLLTRLRRAGGSAVLAVVLSAGLFAGLHIGTQESLVVVPIFLLGVVWGTLTLWQKSVIPAIIGHALFDALNLIALYVRFGADWE